MMFTVRGATFAVLTLSLTGLTHPAPAPAQVFPPFVATVAGTGAAGSCTQGPTRCGGDGGQATAAALSAPAGLGPVSGGGFLIADTGDNVIRIVSPAGVASRRRGSTRSRRGTSPIGGRLRSRARSSDRSRSPASRRARPSA